MSNALTVTAEPGVPFIEFTREFDAPVEAVFRAHKDTELVKQWLGPNGYETQEARDGMVSSGMERGMSEGYERLDALLSA